MVPVALVSQGGSYRSTISCGLFEGSLMSLVYSGHGESQETDGY